MRQVYVYEKTAEPELSYLRAVLLTFSVVVMILNLVNNRALPGIFLFTTVCCAVAGGWAVFLKQVKKIKVGLILSSLFFFLTSFYSIYYGGNAGFQALWYFLFPCFLLILIGFPIGGPFCIIYGILVSIVFWSPLTEYFPYYYPRDYRIYYPFIYWVFCLIVGMADFFYKYYQIQWEESCTAMEQEVSKTVSEAQKLMVSSVAAIGKMIDEKDPYTRQHSQRVAEYSKLIAQNMPGTPFSETELDWIYRSALLHDIGKVAIPDAILNKPGRLTKEEYEVMKQHTVWGKKILEGLKFLPQADYGASYHHERYDGTGYPAGVKGGDVPDIVWVISAADALDAMNSNRCYRKHCDRAYIMEEFRKGSGTQFHPEIARVVMELIQSGKIKV